MHLLRLLQVLPMQQAQREEHAAAHDDCRNGNGIIAQVRDARAHGSGEPDGDRAEQFEECGDSGVRRV